MCYNITRGYFSPFRAYAGNGVIIHERAGNGVIIREYARNCEKTLLLALHAVSRGPFHPGRVRIRVRARVVARVRVRVIRAKVRNSDRGYESADNLNLPRPPPSLYPLQYEKWTHIQYRSQVR